MNDALVLAACGAAEASVGSLSAGAPRLASTRPHSKPAVSLTSDGAAGAAGSSSTDGPADVATAGAAWRALSGAPSTGVPFAMIGTKDRSQLLRLISRIRSFVR
ncbi:MAG: hypothetical protein WDN46_00140 [Methylocella sp.]